MSIIDEIEKILVCRSNIKHKIVENNLKIGEILHKNNCTIKDIIAISQNLLKKGISVSPSFLIDTYNIYKEIKQKRIPLNGTPWFELVAQYSTPPLGNTKEAEEFWAAELEYIMKAENNIENLISRIHAFIDKIPYKLKDEAINLITHVNSILHQKHSNKTITIQDTLRILHTGDLHFEDDEFLEDTIKSAHYIINKAKELKPHLTIIAGDLINSRQKHDSPALLELCYFIKELTSISPVFAIIGTKQHDGLSLQVLNTIKTEYPLYISHTPEIMAFTQQGFTLVKNDQLPENIFCLIFSLPPLPGTRKKQKEDIQKELSIFANKYKNTVIPTILVSHGTVEKIIPDKDAIDYTTEELNNSADLILLGHIHKSLAINDKIFYCGSIIRRNKDEKEEKGIWFHKISLTTDHMSTKKIESEFVIIPTKQIIALDFDHLPEIRELPTKIPPESIIKMSYKINESEKHLAVKEKEIKQYLLDKGASKVEIQKCIIQNHKVRARGISQFVKTEDKIKKAAECLNIELTPSIMDKINLAQQPIELIETTILQNQLRNEENLLPNTQPLTIS